MRITRYKTPEGLSPVREFLESLADGRGRAAVQRRLDRLAGGSFGDHRYLRDGVWELRVHVGPGYRVYYALTGLEVVLLICTGDKASQSGDIDRAVQHWADFKRRSI